MHLYIRSSDFSTEVPEITLLDGHIPAIGPLTPGPDTVDDVFPAMEPAIWFKVLVIDSVSIDCTKRAIHWNSLVVPVDSFNPPGSVSNEPGATGVKPKTRANNRLSESMFVGGECYGYHNDLDELFDSAQKLLDNYVDSKISSSAFHRELFSLLHCYVLPNIKLNVDDIEELAQELEKQGTLIQGCDQEILAKYAKLEEIAKSMKKQRLRYILELTNPMQTDLHYPTKLVKCLQSHIDVDIRDEWDKIESRNEGIQTLKTESDPENSNSSNGDSPQRDNELELSLKREERDSLLKNYELMISARESLHALANGGSVVQNPPPKRWTKKVKKKVSRKKAPPPTNPLHDIYIALDKNYRRMEREIQHTATKKVRMISVKEALKSAIAELKENDETYGVEFDQTGSMRPTDVLRQSRIPTQWQTLTEKLSGYLSKGGSITNFFEEFQNQILVHCQGLLEEHEKMLNAVDLHEPNTNKENPGAINPIFYDMKNAELTSSQKVGCFTLSRTTGQLYREPETHMSFSASEGAPERKSSDFLFVFDKESDYLKKGISKLTKSILQHFEAMVDKFIAKLKLDKTNTNRRKIWLYYESYFYDIIMPALGQLYDKLYASTMLNLQNVLPVLTIKDLHIEDTFLIHLLIPCEAQDIEDDDDELQPRSTSTSNDASGTEDSTGMEDNREQGRTDTDNDGIERKSSPALGRDSIEQVVDRIKDVAVSDKIDAVDNAKTVDDVFCKGLQVDTKDIDSQVTGQGSAIAQTQPVESNLLKMNPLSCSCEDVRRKKKNSAGNSELLSSVGAYKRTSEQCQCHIESAQCLRHSHRFGLSLDDGQINVVLDEENTKPKLQMLPSMTALSSASSSGSMYSDDLIDPLHASDTNLKLLQEAEDLVAGLKAFNPNAISTESSAESLSGAGGKGVARTVSAPSGDQTIPKAMEVQQQTPLPSILRQIKVHHPTSVTVVYHRCTWPIPHAAHTYKHIDADVECAQEALDLNVSSKGKVRQSQLLRYSTLKFRPEIAKRFEEATECLTNFLSETTPLIKLQYLTQCLRRLNQQIGAIQQDLGRACKGASTDDLIDLLVLLLCNFDPVLVCQLYPQIDLLTDVMPPFFEGGPYSFSLVQFSVAFQFLQERMVLKQSIIDNAQARKDLQSIA